jgi:hypothetical protein
MKDATDIVKGSDIGAGSRQIACPHTCLPARAIPNSLTLVVHVAIGFDILKARVLQTTAAKTTNTTAAAAATTTAATTTTSNSNNNSTFTYVVISVANPAITTSMRYANLTFSMFDDKNCFVVLYCKLFTYALPCN